jgi:acyl-CoA dehydrogenase
MSTSATLVDGHWQLSGTKQWISHASYADYAFVFAVTDDRARQERRGGITCFLVPTAADGFRVDSVIKMMGRIGGSECIVSLSDVRVPETHVVGEVGAGFALALRGVNEGRMYNAGRAVGMAQWALGLATDYAQTRRAGGAAIGSHQSVANLLADSAIDIYGGRTMSVQCAREIDDGRSPNIVRDLSIVKAFTTEMGVRVFDRCMQVHGAMGMTNELRLYDGWHQTRAAMVADGTAEIMRRTIAKQLLRGRLDFRTEQPLLAAAR